MRRGDLSGVVSSSLISPVTSSLIAASFSSESSWPSGPNSLMPLSAKGLWEAEIITLEIGSEGARKHGDRRPASAQAEGSVIRDLHRILKFAENYLPPRPPACSLDCRMSGRSTFVRQSNNTRGEWHARRKSGSDRRTGYEIPQAAVPQELKFATFTAALKTGALRLLSVSTPTP